MRRVRSQACHRPPARSARRTRGSSLKYAVPDPKLFDQVRQHGLTGLLRFGERLKGGSAHPNGRPVDIDRAPRSYKARSPVKSRTTAALVTDHERKAAFARAPDLYLLSHSTNAAEVQGHSTIQ